MFDHPKGPNTVFFIARSHRDLSWHLAFNSLRRAANEQDFKRSCRAGAPEERNVLYLEKPRSWQPAHSCEREPAK
jgi:hypothetical protein